MIYEISDMQKRCAETLGDALKTTTSQCKVLGYPLDFMVIQDGKSILINTTFEKNPKSVSIYISY